MLHTTPYYKALKAARAITVRHKHLWVFGFFLAVFGQGTEFASLLRLSQELPGRIVLISRARELGVGNLLLSLIELPSIDPLFFWAGAGLLFAVAALIIYAQVGVILGTERAGRGREVSLRTILTEGTNHFWTFLWTNLSFKAATVMTLMLAMFVGAAAVSFQIEARFELFALVSLVLGASGHLVLSFLRRFALLFLVHQRVGVVAAARNSARLFASNWLPCLELAVILFLIQLCVLFAVTTISLLVITPYLLVAPLIPPIGAWILAVGTLLVVISVVLLGVSWFSTFELASWTALFGDLRSPSKRFSSWLARKLSIGQL